MRIHKIAQAPPVREALRHQCMPRRVLMYNAVDKQTVGTEICSIAEREGVQIVERMRWPPEVLCIFVTS
eukprot:9626154-Lingulodinium_polyedra.AAC.1